MIQLGDVMYIETLDVPMLMDSFVITRTALY